MKVIEAGHKYSLRNMDNPNEFQEINFINMLSDGTRIDGTTNEEVINVLIDRMVYLNSKFPSYYNEACISNLKLSLMALLERTADRTKRQVEGKHEA